MKPRNLSMIVFVAAFLVERGAFAAENEDIAAFGIEASIGGGVVGFTQKYPAELAEVGGSWALRLVFGTRSYLAAEIAYVGSAQELSMQEVLEGSLLASRGAEVLLRFNVIDLGRWQPYTFLGIGYRRYYVIGELFQGSPAQYVDRVGEAPIGGGLAFRFEGFVADVRLELRPAFDNDLMIGGGADNALHSWGTNAFIGWEL